MLDLNVSEVSLAGHTSHRSQQAVPETVAIGHDFGDPRRFPVQPVPDEALLTLALCGEVGDGIPPDALAIIF